MKSFTYVQTTMYVSFTWISFADYNTEWLKLFFLPCGSYSFQWVECKLLADLASGKSNNGLLEETIRRVEKA